MGRVYIHIYNIIYKVIEKICYRGQSKLNNIKSKTVLTEIAGNNYIYAFQVFSNKYLEIFILLIIYFDDQTGLMFLANSSYK